MVILQGKFKRGQANGVDLDVAKTGVRIRILIDWTRTVGFVVQPGHYAAIIWISSHGHVQDHSFPHSLGHAVGNSTLSVGLAEGVAIGVRQAIKTVAAL